MFYFELKRLRSNLTSFECGLGVHRPMLFKLLLKLNLVS